MKNEHVESESGNGSMHGTRRRSDGPVGRRTVLRYTGVAAAGAAAVALGDAQPAGAAPGNFLVLGNPNDSGNQSTDISGTFDGGVLNINGFAGANDLVAFTAGAKGTGVEAVGNNRAGVEGISNAAAGILGTGATNGVEGHGTGNANGVYGAAGSNVPTFTGGAAGVVGVGNTAFGIVGVSNRIGVYGLHGTTSNGSAPSAVCGDSSTGVAVMAVTATGIGVKTAALAAGGTALSVFGNKGTAMNVSGKVLFDRSGVVTIPAGATSANTPAVAGGLTATSRVLATIQTNVTGNVAVKSAVPNTGNGTVGLHLTAPAPAGGVKVAWFVIG